MHMRGSPLTTCPVPPRVLCAAVRAEPAWRPTWRWACGRMQAHGDASVTKSLGVAVHASDASDLLP